MADQWRWELDSLTDLVQRQEPNFGQWYWWIRIRILEFLLARYGPEGHEVRPEPRPIDDIRAGDPVRFGPLPRRGACFRMPLERVSRENEFSRHPLCRTCGIMFLCEDCEFCTQCGHRLERATSS